MGYFDQAPLPAYLAALARPFVGEGALALRLFGLLAGSAAALTLYLVGASVYQSRRAGFYAATLFTFAPIVFLPGTDAPGWPLLGLFWLLSALLLQHAARQDSLFELPLLGLLAGLGLLSGWAMILFWPLALLYLLLNNRHLLRSGWLLWGLLLSFLAVAPLLVWHAGHRFAAFSAVFGGQNGDAIGFPRLFDLTGAEVLALSPFLLLGLLGAGLWCFLHPAKDEERLVFWFTLPYLAFLLLRALSTPTFSGMPGFWVGTLLLFPPLAAAVAGRSNQAAPPWLAALLLGPLALWWRPRTRRLLFGWLLVPALVLDGLFVLHMESDVLAKALPESEGPGGGDFTNTLFGFEELAQTLSGEPQNGRKVDFVAATEPALCAQLLFALRNASIPVYCLSPGRDLFDDFPPPLAPTGGSGLVVSDSQNEQDPNQQLDCEGRLPLWRELPVLRGEREVRRFKLWACTRYIGPRHAGSTVKPPLAKTEPRETPLAPRAARGLARTFPRNPERARTIAFLGKCLVFCLHFRPSHLYYSRYPLAGSTTRARPYTEEKNHEAQYPSRLQSRQNPLRLWRRDRNPLHQGRLLGGNLRQLPSLLHRQAEAGRCRGPRAALQPQIRACDAAAAITLCAPGIRTTTHRDPVGRFF